MSKTLLSATLVALTIGAADAKVRPVYPPMDDYNPVVAKSHERKVRASASESFPVAVGNSEAGPVVEAGTSTKQCLF